MAKIDASKWKSFKLTDIFRMSNTKSIVQKDIAPDSGEIPYVTAQAGNNGVMTFEVKQFIATMIFRESRSYYKAFIDELNRHIKTDFSFYLPVDDAGKPDWGHMEEYMRSVMKNAEIDLTAMQTIF